MKLDAKTVAGVTLPSGKTEAVFFDDAIPGFGLRLRSSGASVWVFQYRCGSRQRRMTLGRADAITPKAAREIASKLHARVKLGHDPAQEKHDSRLKAADTFGAALGPFLARQKARLKPRSYAEVERHLLVQAKPFHASQLTKIDRRTIAARLTAIDAKNGPRAADLVRASLSAFFAWALREGLVDANPVIATNKAYQAPSRDRVLTGDELREIWHGLEDDDYGAIVRLLLLTGQRREEIGALVWREVDLDEALISLPGERTKNKRPHDVPLSPAALAILEARPRCDDRDLVFGRGEGGFSGWSKAKTALDARIAKARNAAAKNGEKIKLMPAWRLHDLRRTASTILHDRLGIAPHIVEAVLNHVTGHRSGVAGVYNRAAYATEKRRALDNWGEHVVSIVEGRESKVTPLRAVK